jgi:hypothetical protein
MRKLIAAAVITVGPLLTGAPAGAQDNQQLAARCTQLGALYDRYNVRRGEGGSGPDLDRVGAGIDCQHGRYDKGIKTLERMLRNARIDVPPA